LWSCLYGWGLAGESSQAEMVTRDPNPVFHGWCLTRF